MAKGPAGARQAGGVVAARAWSCTLRHVRTDPRILRLSLALVLGGCTANLPASAELPVDNEQLAIQFAIAAWHDEGLPWANTCDDEYHRIRVVVSRPREFTELCGRRPLHAGGRLYACTTQQYEAAFPWWMVAPDRVPLLVISELQPRDHRHVLVVHETMHWLERCSGKGIDFDHVDKRVWQTARAEAQRNIILALHHTDTSTYLTRR